LGLISKAEAAKRLERHPSKISKLIDSGDLRVYKPPGQREQVDEDEVERVRAKLRLGEKNIPNSMRPIEPGPSSDDPPAGSQAPPPPPRRKPSDVTEDDIELFDSRGRLDAVACRAWAEFEKARHLNIQRLALEGQYVLASEVGPAFERAMLTINKGVLATPSRLKALQPDLSQSVLDTLDRLLREALEKAVDNSTNAN
jgi:excisionase family DNA binding protein